MLAVALYASQTNAASFILADTTRLHCNNLSTFQPSTHIDIHTINNHSNTDHTTTRKTHFSIHNRLPRIRQLQPFVATMAAKLSGGSLAAIFAAGCPNPKEAWKDPIMQILLVKKIEAQGKTPERYRIVVSDGLHFTQGMIASRKL